MCKSIDHSCGEYCNFYLVNYFTETCHQPAIFFTPSLNDLKMCHSMVCPPMLQSNNKNSRSIDHSSGECCNLLCGKLFDSNLLLLTCHLLPLSPTMNFKSHAPHCTFLWHQSNNQKRIRLFDQSSREYCKFYWFYLELSVPDLPYSVTPISSPHLKLSFPVASIKQPKEEADR